MFRQDSQAGSPQPRQPKSIALLDLSHTGQNLTEDGGLSCGGSLTLVCAVDLALPTEINCKILIHSKEVRTLFIGENTDRTVRDLKMQILIRVLV